MHGAQGPGGPRWGLVPGSSRSRAAGRGVYVRRRILAVLVLLLLLALLVPRAYQAFLGSNEDTGSREDQRAGAPETATGSNAENADTGKAGTKDTSSDRGAPFIKGEAGSEGTSGAEAATNLTAMIVGPAVIGSSEEPAVEDVAGGELSADQTAQRPASTEAVGRPQNALNASRAPARRPPSDNEGAPTNRQGVGPSGTAANLPRERIRGGGDLVATVPVPARSRFGGVRARPPKPVAIEPVATAPVAPAPTAVPSGLANNFGGTTVGGAGPAPAALPRGPRLAATAPIRTPRSAIF